MKKLKNLYRRMMYRMLERQGALLVDPGNTVVLVASDGTRRQLTKPYPGLVIHCAGHDNYIEIAEGIPFETSELRIAGNNHTVVIAPTTRMVKNLIIDTWGSHHATISIGHNFQCAGFAAYITMANPILGIGENCLFAWDINVWMGYPHALINLATGRAEEPASKAFSIGNHVWVGHGVSFTKNVEIAEGCIVAAGSVVTRNVSKPNSLVAGNPAQVKREGVTWAYPMAEWYNAVLDNDYSPERLGFWCSFVEKNHKDELTALSKALKQQPTRKRA